MLKWLPLLLAGVLASPFSECWTRKDFATPCILLYLSKILGYFLVLISFGLKLPQIAKILTSKSVKGLSPISFYVEVYSFGLMSAYCLHAGQALNTFGDNIVLCFQCLIQVALLWYYGSFSFTHKTLLTLQFVVTFHYLVFCSPPDSLWNFIIALNLPINTVVKGSQMIANMENQSTGQLSLGTVGLSLFGCLIRILTSAVETSDLPLVINYVVGTIYNAILVGQIFYYNWGAAEKKKKE